MCGDGGGKKGGGGQTAFSNGTHSDIFLCDVFVCQQWLNSKMKYTQLISFDVVGVILVVVVAGL